MDHSARIHPLPAKQINAKSLFFCKEEQAFLLWIYGMYCRYFSAFRPTTA